MHLPLLLALGLLAAPDAPASRHPLTVDDLLAFERVGDPDLSPDGALVAFTVSRAASDGGGLRAALWVVATRGGEPRRLTHGEERVRAPRFSPDGRRLAFVASRGGSPQLWLLPLDGGEAAPAARVPGGVGEFRWAPDGALLVLADVDPACGADLACNEKADAAAAGRPYLTDRLLFRHWDEWRTRKRVHLLRLPPGGGPAVDLTPGDRDAPPANRGGIGDVEVSPDGKTIYFVAVTDPVEALSTNGDLFAVQAEGGPARQLTRAPGWDGSPRASPDGKRLAWLRMARPGYEGDRRHVVVAAADGSGEKDLTAAGMLPAGLDVSADHLWWVDGSRALRFTAEVAGRHAVFEVDPATGRATRLLDGVHVGALVPSRDGRRAVVTFDSIFAPAEVGLLAPDPKAGGRLALSPVTRVNEERLAGLSRGELTRLEATSQDGTRVHGWLLTPPGHLAGQRHPGVVLVHGGPQGAWTDGWSYRWNPWLYASRGWTVVLPNPRGSTGWGQPYTDAIRGDWGTGPFEDIMALTDAAVSVGALDGDLACAAGASYGGTMVNWINGHTGRFRCLVAHAGWFDLAAGYVETEELWFPEWEMQGTPWDRASDYARQSPSTFVQAWRTPTLVSHGELDYRVTVTQGIAAYTALQRRGVESRLMVFPDENHWVLKPRNTRVFYEEVLGWIERHLAEPRRAPTTR